MGSKAPKAPDFGPLMAGSQRAAELGYQTAQDQLAWAKEQNAMNQELLREVLGPQREIMQEQLRAGRMDRQRYEQMFQPLEENLVREFQGYDTPARRQEERGRAVADVNQAFDAQRRNALQRLESYGVDPSQTRNAALDIGMRTQQAAAQAGAASAADRATEQTGRALRAEAINIGKGLPSNVAASYGQSLGAGNAMMGGANQAAMTGSNLMGAGAGMLNTAIGGYGGAANIGSQGFQNQMASFNANQQGINSAMGAMGGIAGMFMREGGALPIYDSEPGEIDYGVGDGTGIDDQVPIQASRGEYIIPADVVRKKGEEFFDKLIEKYHTPAEEQREDEYTNAVATGRALNPTPRMNGGRVYG